MLKLLHFSHVTNDVNLTFWIATEGRPNRKSDGRFSFHNSMLENYFQSFIKIRTPTPLAFCLLVCAYELECVSLLITIPNPSILCNIINRNALSCTN